MISARTAKISWTTALYLAFFALGLIIAIPGPTLLDLQCHVNTTSEGISYIYTARSGGYVLGSMLGGFLHDWLRHEPLIMVCLLFSAAGITLAPWSAKLSLLCAALGVVGIFTGSIDSGGNVFILSLWGDNSAPFLQALHFTFGIGALVSPIIAEPFLSPLNRNNTNNGTNALCNFNETSPTANSKYHVEYAYLIIGCYCFLIFALFAVLFMLTNKLPTTSKVHNKNNIQKRQDNYKKFLKFTLIGMTFLFNFMYCGFEVVLGQLLASFAVTSKLQMTKSAASYLTSAFWASYTIGRGTAIAVATRFSATSMIYFNLFLLVVGGVVFVLWGEVHPAALWVATIVTGLGVAPNFASTITFIEELFPITGRIAGFYVVSAASGEMVLPLLVGQFMGKIPAMLLYVSLGLSLCCCIIFFIIHGIAILFKRRLAPPLASSSPETLPSYLVSQNDATSSSYLEGPIKY